ncbi:MAG: DUF3099 domain-containing protein [Kineosporiaceae bacterium]
MSRAPRSQEPARPDVYRITSAAGAQSADMQQRAVRYLVSMGVRTVCVVLVIVVPGPLRWVFAVGAIALPYIAVVAANAAGERRQRPAPAPTPTAPASLPRPVPTATVPAETIDTETVDTETVDTETIEPETIEPEPVGPEPVEVVPPYRRRGR